MKLNFAEIRSGLLLVAAIVGGYAWVDARFAKADDVEQGDKQGASMVMDLRIELAEDRLEDELSKSKPNQAKVDRLMRDIERIDEQRTKLQE